MDYSPYQRKNRSFRRKNEGFSFWLFALSALIGFLLFWGIKSLFFAADGMFSPVTYAENSSRAEILIPEDGAAWANAGTGYAITNGDKIRSKKGNSGTLTFENGTQIVMGLGSEIEMGEVEKSENGEISGEVFINKGPVILDQKGKFSEDGLKFWVKKGDVYLQASQGKTFVQRAGAAALEGENFVFQKIDKSQKIRDSKRVGIGQYLDFESFTLKGTPESVKKNVLTESFFAASEEISEENPVETPKSTNGESAPTITSPAGDGEIFELTQDTQIIKGTAPAGTKYIWVYYTNEKGETDEYKLKNFKAGDKEWSYVAKPQYDTLAEGKNTYRVYAENSDKEKSAPATLVMEYKKDNSAPQIFTNSKGKLIITAPNSGSNTTQTSRTISLKGVAPTNASYITVVNKTLGSEYTLKAFRKGNKTWSYSAGPLDAKKYTYLVKAQDSRKRTLSSDSISVTIKGATSTGGGTSKPAATKPSSAEPEKTPAKTTQKPSPTPAKKSSSEASR